MIKKIHPNYCTLFDSNYLDKGCVMIESLLAVATECNIFVLCMDEKCFEVLKDISFPKTTLIKISDFIDEELRIVQSRSRAEFCWSCTGKLIKYVLTECEKEICTYIDSDLYFYSDPSVLIEEMLDEGCSVQVVSHRFPKTNIGKLYTKNSGSNCVQFNTFIKGKNSLELLDNWIELCLEECSWEQGGDQKYTDKWGELSFVNVSCNGGAGMAPWNIFRYRQAKGKHNIVYDRYDKKEYEMIFFHFQNIEYINRYLVSNYAKTSGWLIDERLIDSLFADYLEKIEKAKIRLQRDYNISAIYSHSDVHEKIKRETSHFTISDQIARIELKLIHIVRRKAFFEVKKFEE